MPIATENAGRPGEPVQPFATRWDAARFLLGLSGFWAGFAGICLTWISNAPGLVIILPVALSIAGAVLHGQSTRRLEEAMTGRSVRPWPLGYTRLRTQIQATIPSTVIAAAKRLDTNVILVTSVIYALFAADLVAFVATWYVRR
jgi:hypothetical protein